MLSECKTVLHLWSVSEDFDSLCKFDALIFDLLYILKSIYKLELKYVEWILNLILNLIWDDMHVN